MDLLERIFSIRAKDELGQYLDDEQQWQEGMPFTRQMSDRLRVLIEEARNEIMEKLGRVDDWLLARKVVEFILRRRGGQDYEAFATLNKIELEKKSGTNIVVKTDERKINVVDIW